MKCKIDSIASTVITCTTGPRSAGLVDIVVSSGCSILGCDYTFNNGFTYDDSVQPKITDINPMMGPTYGGIVLTITGTSFPTAPEEVTVTMGARRCEVKTTSSTEVTCTVPSNPPGNVNVVVDTEVKGKNIRGESRKIGVLLGKITRSFPHTKFLRM